jgi:[NiFe] hydrogenase assembly HybE family chaperone
MPIGRMSHPSAGIEAGHAQRIMALEAITRAHDAMLDGLSIYNPALSVEAIGFRPVGPAGAAADLLGALVTPWAIDLVLLPIVEIPFDPDKVGASETLLFPCGPRVFTWSGERAVGLFRHETLQAPCPHIESHDAAIALARSALATLLSPPPPVETTPATQTAAGAPSRRSLLFGRRPG